MHSVALNQTFYPLLLLLHLTIVFLLLLLLVLHLLLLLFLLSPSLSSPHLLPHKSGVEWGGAFCCTQPNFLPPPSPPSSHTPLSPSPPPCPTSPTTPFPPIPITFLSQISLPISHEQSGMRWKRLQDKRCCTQTIFLLSQH